MEGICVNFLDPVHFFRFLKGRCHGNQFFCRTGLVRSEPKYLRIRWTDFHNLCTIMVGIGLQMITTFYFLRYLKGRCHGNQFSGKNGAKLPTLHLSLCQSKTEWDIATSMCALTAQMMPLYRVNQSVKYIV